MGELEIVTSEHVCDKEHSTRLQVLKKLAYNHEFLPLLNILNQYACFISKIEKGKYKWGSKASMLVLDQQLMYNVSLERGRVVRDMTGRAKIKGGSKEEWKKYCLDYNKGTCQLSSPHEGPLNGVSVLKHHICKKCLLEEGVERQHPSKECRK